MVDKKEKPSQLELFSHSADSEETKRSTRIAFHHRIHLSLEHIIVLSVVVLMLVIFSFSLGVERGKNIVNIQADQSAKTSIEKVEEIALVIEVKEEVYKEEVSTKEEIFTYTIQVASFQKKASVEQEAERLQNKGYETIVMTKGKWVILCVGKFTNKQEAEVMQKELRKKYGDCIIRKI